MEPLQPLTVVNIRPDRDSTRRARGRQHLTEYNDCIVSDYSGVNAADGHYRYCVMIPKSEYNRLAGRKTERPYETMHVYTGEMVPVDRITIDQLDALIAQER
jgi:hypothetical protein